MKFTKHLKKIKILVFLIIFCLPTQFFFAETTSSDKEDTDEITINFEPYTKDNIPDWAHDLRRAEIITFGSLPFTTLSCTFIYSLYRYYDSGFDSTYFPNPFPSSSDDADLSTDEQIAILKYSCGFSLFVGITDFIICTIKEQKEQKEERASNDIKNGTIVIIPESKVTETDPSNTTKDKTEIPAEALNE
ncbi:MAG: hypothetical protein BKP49_08655 [Treponema sp. CETP13]|nr:MAG: hypothetical protein BKP49_08655 [Treponema sp. CETP13]